MLCKFNSVLWPCCQACQPSKVNCLIPDMDEELLVHNLDKELLHILMCFQLGYYLLHISFSSETFSKVYAGVQPLPLHHYSSTAIKVWLPDLRGHTLYERNTNCGICGVSAPVFLRRRHILAGLQCAE